MSRVGPPLNKELFPVHRPSGLKRAVWNFFFSIFSKKNIIIYKKKLNEKKKDSRPTDWPLFCRTGGQETIIRLRMASSNPPFVIGNAGADHGGT